MFPYKPQHFPHKRPWILLRNPMPTALHLPTLYIRIHLLRLHLGLRPAQKPLLSR